MSEFSVLAAHPEPQTTPMTFTFGPFRYSSEIVFPEMQQDLPGSLLPITIRLAAVPDLPHLTWVDASCAVAPAEYLLIIEGVARYHVLNGSEVRVQLEPNAPMADVRGYLMGSIFGALCHQNGLLPMHGSAVLAAGEVTAFLGDSGAGKSTMAAFLKRRGYPIVSDDICLLHPQQATPGDLPVIPVAGWLKLWRESWNQLGETPEEENRVFTGNDKFRLYIEPPAGARPRLRNVVILRRPAANEDQTPRLEMLSGAQAITELMDNTYLCYLPVLTGGEQQLFLRCAAVLRFAKAYRLRVPAGFEHMPAVLDLIERELLKQD